jgi:hypothetical protein
LRRVVASCARRASRVATACSNWARDTSFCAASVDSRAAFASASFSCACTLAIWLCEAASCEADSVRWACASTGSSRASTWPSSTFWPSSISTSRTRPVTLADTVAMRRATT